MDCLQLSNATVDTSSPMERCRAVHAVIAFSLDEFAIDVRNMTDRRRMRFRFARLTMTLLTLCSGVNACATASRGTSAVVEGTPPAYVLGSFVDDYGGHHTISPSEWVQGRDDRYRIVRWNADAHYLIAENNSTGPASLGRWTRIDWVPLDGLPPYRWAFCFSAYEMKTAAAAESSMVAKTATPRDGCNGYPFTRMRSGR
jgi:hypothetical protein